MHRYRMPKTLLWKEAEPAAYKELDIPTRVHFDQVNHRELNGATNGQVIGVSPSLLAFKGWFASAIKTDRLRCILIETEGFFLKVIDLEPRPDVEQALKGRFEFISGFRFLLPNEFIPLGKSNIVVHGISNDGSRVRIQGITLDKRIGVDAGVIDPVELQHELHAQSEAMSGLYLSKSWRWTGNFRKLVDLTMIASSMKRAVLSRQDKDATVDRTGAYKRMLNTVLDAKKQWDERARSEQRRLKWEKEYSRWRLQQRKGWQREVSDGEMESWERKPLVSIIVPVYNVERKWLNRCVESVLKQAYPNWELCLYDDASTLAETIHALKQWEGKDDRIKVKLGKENGHISKASNRSIDMASGTFVALLDNDDELTEDALYQVIKALNEHPETDMFFSDEDKLEMDGTFSGAYFKPGFNKHLFLANNYLCHFSVIRKSVGDKIGWFRPGYEGSQDFDLFLRLSHATDKIRHLPKVLYHWRKIPGSTAAEYSTKSYANASSIKAISEHLEAENTPGSVHNGLWPGSFRVKYTIKDDPLVSIIVPFKDQPEFLENCVNSILEKTKYKNYEIILVNNNSREERTLKFVEAYESHPLIQVIHDKKAFNFARINNEAAKKAKGDFLVFLNNDTKVIAHDWLSAMLEYAQQKDVGAVGAKLLYEDCTVQHAGVLLGVGGVATHAFHGFADGDNFAFGQLNVVREYMAVSAACMMVEKKKYFEVGGMDEQLAVAYNDVDLCLSFRKAGLVNIYTPYAKLFHFESKSRGYENTPEKKKRLAEETTRLYDKWGDTAKEDVYYSPNLAKDAPDFSIALT